MRSQRTWGAWARTLAQCDEPKPVAGELDVNDHGRAVLVNWVGTGATLRDLDGICSDGDSFWPPNLILIRSKLLARSDLGVVRLAVTPRPGARRNQIRRSAVPLTGPRAAFADAVAARCTGGIA
jgi:hypothetical protein